MNLEKRKSTLVIFILALILVFTLSACSGNGESGASQGGEGSGSAADADQASAGGATDGTWRIGFLNFGPEWQLNDMMAKAKQAAMWANSENEKTWKEADGGYMADQMTSEIQRLLSSGIDGLCYDAHFEPMLTDTIAKCKQANAALVLAYTPTFPERNDELRAYEKFVGYFGEDLYQKGYLLGVRAAENGGTKAIIASGARGTIDMNEKIDGFTKGFTDGGGEIVDTITTTLPTEVEGRVADSLAAHPDCDTIYGAVGVHCLGALEAAKKAGKANDIKFYSSEIDIELFNMVGRGEIAAATTGSQVDWAMGIALLVNFLDGHPILDENGQAPIIDWMTPIIVDQDNYEEVKIVEFDNNPLTENFFKSYLWAYNPDVSYADFQEFADNYSIDWLKQKQEQFGE
jgi:ribose transport system substrate-binding protein